MNFKYIVTIFGLYLTCALPAFAMEPETVQMENLPLYRLAAAASIYPLSHLAHLAEFEQRLPELEEVTESDSERSLESTDSGESTDMEVEIRPIIGGKQDLADAIQNGNIQRAAVLIDSLPQSILLEVGEHKRTFLMLAAQKGHVELIAKLIQAGLPINATDEERCTALMYAVRSVSLDAVKCLLDSGADAGIFNRHGRQALFYAYEYEESRALPSEKVQIKQLIGLLRPYTEEHTIENILKH